jgi:2-methylisocitrate lyase-like PEP mutase family enzyme
MSILDDPDYIVVPVPDADRGVAWLRAHVARFSEGADHDRRRALAEAMLTDVDPTALARSGSPVANLASALGLPAEPALVADVAVVAGAYQPHTRQSVAADEALARLVAGCGAGWDEMTAARIGLLVQAHAATYAMIAGADPPVPFTRRVGPTGDEVRVDLAQQPFGSGRHACPGRRHAIAMVDGALRFRRMHDGPEPLVLPDVWDVGSASALVDAGVAAIGTTRLALARQLARLPVPVTVDIGYGFDADLEQLAAELSVMGIAGVTIEDGRRHTLADPTEQADLIRRLKRAGPELFVNARVDTYWIGTAHDETLPRAQSYVDAGADGVFVPGLDEPARIEPLVAALPVPLNLLAGLPLGRLAELGVRRVSTGSGSRPGARSGVTSTVEDR